jgi:hypothetical protein
MNNAPFPDLRGEHRTEPVPPEANRPVANVDAALEQQVLDLTERQRIADIHHHREADNFGRAVEIGEGIFHPLRLGSITRRLKPLYSDNAQYSLLSFRDHVEQCCPRLIKKRLCALQWFAGAWLKFDWKCTGVIIYKPVGNASSKNCSRRDAAAAVSEY